jgi:hypothetical protein
MHKYCSPPQKLGITYIPRYSFPIYNLVLWQCNCKLLGAGVVVLAIDVKIYVESFPLRNHPGNKIFKRLVGGLKKTGSLKPKTKDVVNKPITIELNKAIVLNYADRQSPYWHTGN